MKKLALSAAVLSCLLAAPAFAQEEAPAEQPAKSADGPDIGFELRSGVTGNYVASDPNFFGIGALAEPMVKIGGLGAGLRVDAMAMFGINLADDVQAGIRVLAGILPKVEYSLGSDAVSVVGGLAFGYYTVAVTGASVSADREDVGAIAGGGQAFGFAPQIGLNLGGFRIAVLSHFVFAGGQLEPVFALELSGRTFKFP